MRVSDGQERNGSWCSPLSDHASESDVARSRIDRLGMARGRAVAATIVRCAQMRATLENLARNPDLRLKRIVTLVFASSARVLGNAAGFGDIGFVFGHVPIGGPFPDIADHIVKAVAV